MKNIKNWFVFRSEDEFEASYFQENEEGKDVFYPWGCSGDSYYIDGRQKKSLKFFLRFMVWLVLIFLPLIFLYFELSNKGLFNSNWSVVTAITVFVFIYISGVCFLLKALGMYVQKVPARYKNTTNIQLFRLIFKLGLLQLAILFVGFLYDPYDYFLWGAAGFTIIFYSVFTFFAWFKKGCLLQKKPPAG